ncbi:DUF4236 domain-containing protein [Paenibacillus sp. KQZ6P-2]|uniref:DUF4236 domain-containing protein n=1 Tax=Paenibacillus mangrovi TaxID=2931978 RepID=A0A9X1WQU4_9BACL|nr:DUF4236 domain-containing protein [Paenibacillus mangrovi]MCJ8013389.1 DUF4236 domain-containing protein [Paenibacillus mangrovi]
MGLRFRKSIKIAPGIRLNVSTKSTGISFGGKGLRYSINSRTGSRITASIPGTGLSYSATSRSGRQYKSQAYHKRNELVRLQREMDKLEKQKQAIYEVQMFENQVEIIKSIHKECDEAFHWNDIRQMPAPFLSGEKGPRERFAQQELDNFKPNIIQKWFKTDVKKRIQLSDKIDQAIREDQEDYKNWENVISTASKIVSGDIDEYLKVIEELSPLDDLSEFGSGFEFFIEEPKTLEVEFEVHSQNVIPTETKTLTKSGKLSVKPMTKTNYFDLYQEKQNSRGKVA